ncbi:hypothetical protein IWQ62_004706 [Dispira parvispora]|uniref:MARVEL domain-containing protein n=1 Tax=Dispira parvispora TaxID=1520584 RepID=A0A9W8AP96_9FUNG|nr:hypothetical protein IWQ62_004706 [Dispira parvispora]
MLSAANLRPVGTIRYLAYAAGFVLSFITFVMWCYLVDFIDSAGGSSSEFNFAVFAGLFGIAASLVYLLTPYLRNRMNSSVLDKILQPVVETVLTGLATIFWFAAAIATAAAFGTPKCFFSQCHTTKAAIAFSWFSFAAFGVALGFLVKEWLTNRNSLLPTSQPTPQPATEFSNLGAEKPPEAAPVSYGDSSTAGVSPPPQHIPMPEPEHMSSSQPPRP